MSHWMLKATVEHILRNHSAFRWTVQGFGMLRTYLPGNTRLAVWDSRFAVANVSLIHDHPWSFKSTIVAGALHNQRFEVMDHEHVGCVPHMVKVIRPGEGTIDLSDAERTWLLRARSEDYTEGCVYEQRANEVHSSHPLDGTVTLVHRSRVGADEARVFWPKGEQWVSGEPRVATSEEVAGIVGRSLDEWFQ